MNLVSDGKPPGRALKKILSSLAHGSIRKPYIIHDLLNNPPDLNKIS
jgi:hypothetical protein